MNEYYSKLPIKSPYAYRTKRINSQNQKQNMTSLVQYQNHQSEDYREPQSKLKTQNCMPPLNPSSTRGSFIRKNIRKNDIRSRYMSSEKNEFSKNIKPNNIQQFREGNQSRVSEGLVQPQKPNFKARYTITDNESEQISNIQHQISRNQTQTLLIGSQQKQILIGFDTNLFAEAHKVLEQLQDQIFKGNTSNLIRKYLQIIATGQLDDYSNVHFNLHKRKVIKTAILYQRISVILIAFSEVTRNLSSHQNFLSNILKYVIDSRIIILSLLQTRLQKLQTEITFISTEFPKVNKQSRSFQIIRDNNQIILQIIYKLSNEDNYFFQNLRKFIKGGSTFTIQQCFYFILEYFAFFLHLSGMEDKIPFLAVAPNPYLPPAEKYTLVFDFMEVMYNHKQNSFRPHSQIFIEEMSHLYELVSFSAVYPKQIQEIIKHVDRKNRITHKLYKHHMVKYKSRLEKDLTRIGRPLSMIVLLDVEQSLLSPNNTFKVRKWNGSAKDNVLASITQFIASIPAKRLNAQLAISSYKEQQLIKKRLKDKVTNYGIKQI